MTEKTKTYMRWIFARVVSLGLDVCILAIAYGCAFLLRFDFKTPMGGWTSAALSFTTVCLVQMSTLLVFGCWTQSWRQARIIEFSRILLAVFVSAMILMGLRIAMPDVLLCHVRPPYSITLIYAFLACIGLIGARLVWRIYCRMCIRPEAILGREEVLPDSAAVMDLLRDSCVLVTGAGGTIGAEIVRQISRSGPSMLVLVERSENALYEIEREIRRHGCSVPCAIEMADMADTARMESIFERYHPAIVLHAAAFKHVPMVERNPITGLRNNMLATRALGEIAMRYGTKRFVFISTDKAVNPVSVMGVTKRLAEIALQDLNRAGKTRFSAVRFGNVLGSSGSVVPLFKEQIEHREPVTITHPDMKRYFMTVHEAVALVLQAAALAEGGEIFILDMGEPVRIFDLAKEMINQAGYRPFVDIPIVFSGIRPGEKLFEELDVSERAAYKTGCARVFIAHDKTPSSTAVVEMLSQARVLAGEKTDDDSTARDTIFTLYNAMNAGGKHENL